MAPERCDRWHDLLNFLLFLMHLKNRGACQEKQYYHWSVKCHTAYWSGQKSAPGSDIRPLKTEKTCSQFSVEFDSKYAIQIIVSFYHLSGNKMATITLWKKISLIKRVFVPLVNHFESSLWIIQLLQSTSTPKRNKLEWNSECWKDHLINTNVVVMLTYVCTDEHEEKFYHSFMS